MTASEVLIKASVNWHTSDMALSGHIPGGPVTGKGAGTGMLGWLVVADDASFASTESSTVPNLANTLQEILNINHDTTNDNGSVVSSPEDYGITTTNQGLIIDPGASMAIISRPLLLSPPDPTS